MILTEFDFDLGIFSPSSLQAAQQSSEPRSQSERIFLVSQLTHN